MKKQKVEDTKMRKEQGIIVGTEEGGEAKAKDSLGILAPRDMIEKWLGKIE